MTPSPQNLLKAFADETRLRILSLLTGGELCVCDIMAVMKTSPAKGFPAFGLSAAEWVG
jgi:DNA-binding transcriptional ArsR family regulator